MLFHWQWFFAQIWLGVLSGDTKGIIIWDWGLAPSSVEVIENKKCWKSNSKHVHNPGKCCKCCKPLLWTMEATQSWTRSSAGVTGIAPPNSAIVYWCEHNPENLPFGGFVVKFGWRLPAIFGHSCSAFNCYEKNEIQGSWDLKYDEMKSKTEMWPQRGHLFPCENDL